MRIDKILGTSEITTKDGKKLKKTQFLSGSQVYFTFSDIKDGDDREEESRSDFTRNDGQVETTIKFKSAVGGRGGFSKTDPTSFHVSYAKDIIVSMINNGLLKDEKEIAKQWINFSQVSKNIYDKLSKGESVIKTQPTQSSSQPDPNEPPIPSDDDIDVASEVKGMEL